MKLNKDELKLVWKLQHNHRQWLMKWRYISLVSGIVLAATAIYGLNGCVRFFNPSYPPWLGTAFFVQCYFLCGMAGAMIGYAIGLWNGKPTDILLLKLLEDKIEKESKDD